MLYMLHIYIFLNTMFLFLSDFLSDVRTRDLQWLCAKKHREPAASDRFVIPAPGSSAAVRSTTATAAAAANGQAH